MKVQESAAAQYTRLEDLTRRLEALNPPPKEASSQESVVDSTTTTPPQQSAVLEAQQPGGSGNVITFLNHKSVVHYNS